MTEKNDHPDPPTAVENLAQGPAERPKRSLSGFVNSFQGNQLNDPERRARDAQSNVEASVQALRDFEEQARSPSPSTFSGLEPNNDQKAFQESMLQKQVISTAERIAKQEKDVGRTAAATEKLLETFQQQIEVAQADALEAKKEAAISRSHSRTGIWISFASLIVAAIPFLNWIYAKYFGG